MSKEFYNKETIDSFMHNIDEKLDAIHEQTLKTNGRVNRLETWKSYITGATAVVVMLVVPLFLSSVREVLAK